MAQIMQSVERVNYYQNIATLTDAHCHLDLMEDPAAAVNDALSKGVNTIITSGGSAKSNDATSDITKRLGVYGVVGIDPSFASADSECVERLHTLIKSNVHLIGIGEIGLDSKVEEENPPELQRRLLIRQIGIANELGVPVVIHSRGRMAEVMEIVEENVPERAMFHFFEGTVEQAKVLAGKGWLISIPPRLNEARRRVIKEIDLTNIVAETDAPVAGKTPSEVREVIEQIASIKDIDFSDVAERLTENVKGFFHI